MQRSHSQTTITGTVVRIIASYEACCIALIENDEGDEIKVVGPPNIQLNKEFELHGRWKDHPRHGTQFSYDLAIPPAIPESPEGIKRELAKLPDIGPATASKLYDKFGTDVFDRLMDDAAGTAEAIGMKPHRLNAASAEARETRDGRSLRIELSALLDNGGFPRALPELLIEKHGADTPAKIKENPFILLEFRGVGFRTADALYSKLGLDPDAVERQIHCAIYAMQESTEGHTWHPVSSWCDSIMEFIGADGANPDFARGEAVDRQLIVSRTDPVGQEWLAIAADAHVEANLAQRILQVTTSD